MPCPAVCALDYFDAYDLVLAFEARRRAHNPATDSYADLEMAKIKIAEAVLQSLGFETEPTPTGLPKYRKQQVPNALRWAVFERDNFTCLQCGSRRELEADHIIPESKGGPTITSNLQTLCKTCNSKKRAEVPEGVSI